MRFFPATFKDRLALLVAGLTLVVGLPVYVYIDHVFSRQLVIDRGSAIRDLASSVAAVMAQNLAERQREIELLARTAVFRRSPLDSPELGESLERLKDSYPHYSWIGLADVNGKVHAATGNMLVGMSVAERPWFRNGLRGPYIGNLHEAVLLSSLLPGELGPVRFIDFAAPVFTDGGVLRGVLAAHAHWRWAGDAIKVLMPGNAAAERLDIFIANEKGEIIYPDVRYTPARVPETVTADHPFVLHDWGTYTDFVAAVAPVPEIFPDKPLGWRIVVRQPTGEALAEVAELQRILLISALVYMVCFLALAWWSARLLSRPLEQLVHAARRIEQGDERESLAVATGTWELRRLSDALRGMTATLIERRRALAETNARLEHMVEARTAELELANAELAKQARSDALTGLANRLAAGERLHDEFERMKRLLHPYAVVLIDVDYFKRINDTHGHAAGDEVLRRIAATLKATVRASDFVARYGGEEFLVMLPDIDLDSAIQVAEKLRVEIASTPLPTGRATISAGVAMASIGHPDESAAVREADALLYAAKRGGRNRVVSHEDSEMPR